MQRDNHDQLWPDTADGTDRKRTGSIAVDQNTDTIYVANAGDNTVSVINGATCNAQNTSGCGQTRRRSPSEASRSPWT